MFNASYRQLAILHANAQCCGMKKHAFPSSFFARRLTFVLLVALALAVEAGLLTLANWQWGRYQQRLAQQTEFASRPAVTLSGTWQPQHTVALTNQPHPLSPESSRGWRILTPLITASGTVLIDRGFTPPSVHTDNTPNFTPFQPVTISTTLSGVWQPFPQRRGWLRGPDVTTHPRLLAFLNPAHSVSATGPAYLISRTPTSPNLTAVPPPLPAPTKHLSYALQWLGMALAFPIMCLVAMRAKRRATNPRANP